MITWMREAEEQGGLEGQPVPPLPLHPAPLGHLGHGDELGDHQGPVLQPVGQPDTPEGPLGDGSVSVGEVLQETECVGGNKEFC